MGMNWERGALTRFSYLDIVTAHLTLPHLSIFGERPVLESVATLPLHPVVRVLELIPELDGNLVACEGEQLLAQSIVLLLLPLLCEELFDCSGANNEGCPVPPDAVRCIGLGDDLWVSDVVSKLDSGAEGRAHWVFQRSCAFLTFACAVSWVNGGVRDIGVIGDRNVYCEDMHELLFKSGILHVSLEVQS